MKPCLVLLALLSASPALACPPSLPGEEVPSRAEMLRRQAQALPNIVYAVVERTRDEPDEGGYPLRQVRILHVYKGGLQVGRRLWMRLLVDNTECGSNMPAELVARRGDYGLLVLPALMEGAEPPYLWGLLDDSDARVLIDAGIIRSAREADSATPPGGAR